MMAALGRLTLVLAVALVAVAGVAFSQSYDAGLKAYEAGEYDGALVAWQPLAEGGDPVAQYSLGKLLERGGGAVTQDFAEAARWYQAAAAQGIAAAQNNLALMYAQGRGVERNLPRAIELWQSAAQQNHPMAQYNLGLAYFRGEGVAKDEREASDWFRRAADAGLADAQYAMGQMNRLGLVLPKNQGLALFWYRAAAEQGHREAKSQVQLLEAAGVQAVESDAPAAAPGSVVADNGDSDAAPQPDAASPAPQDAAAVMPAEAAPAATSQQSADAAKTEKAAAPETQPESVSQPQSAEQVAQLPESAPADTAALESVDSAGGHSDGQLAPRRKPAVPQLAMQQPTAEGLDSKALEPEELEQVAATGNGTATPAVPPAGQQQSESEGSQGQGGPEVPAIDTAAGESTPTETESDQGTAAADQGNGTDQGTGARRGVQVWLASEQSAKAAMGFWPKAQAQFPELLAKAQPEVRRVDLGVGGVFYRLMVGPLKSRDAARDLCALMRLQDEDAFCKLLPD